MLQAKQVLQERYYLQQSLGQNAGCQTWLAQERSLTPKVSLSNKREEAIATENMNQAMRDRFLSL
jgi:hypothetical protein